MNREDGIYIHGKKVRDLTKVEELQIDLFYLKEEKENLIKYLEDRYNFLQNIENHTQVSIGRRDEIKDLLERVKSGNYE